MAEPKDPRIRVDLNILRDANLDRLEEFARQFSDPANRLAEAMEKFNARAGRAIGGVSTGSGQGSYGFTNFAAGQQPGGAPPSGPSSGASTGGGGGGGGRPGRPSPGASQPNRFGDVGSIWQRAALAGPYINQYERGLIRTGAFPGDNNVARSMMAASWMTGHFGWRPAEPSEVTPAAIANGDVIEGEDDKYYIQRGSGLAANVSRGFGLVGQASMRIPQAFGAAQGFINGVTGFGGRLSLAGMQSGGYSRLNGMGLPFFSPAMMHGLGMQWQALKQSWFGFNPNYSTAQAEAAQQAIANSGYWGGDAHFLASQMRNLQITSNLSPEQTMALFDPLMRMGGEDRSRLAESLKSLNDSAKSAHIGLDQFNQSLTQAAEQVAGQTGMQVGQASTMLQALSAGTRLDPQRLAGLTDPTNMFVGAALTGLTPADIVLRGKGAGAALALPMLKFQATMGMPFDTYMRLKRENPNDPRVKQAENMVSTAIMSDPNYFGGLDVRTMMNLASRGVNMPERMQAVSDAMSSSFHDTQSFENIIRRFGAGGNAGQNLMREFMTGKFHGRITAQNATAAQQWLTHRMNQIMNKSSDKASHTVTVTLDNWAKQLVHIKGGKDTSTRNSGDNTWHKAIDFGGEAVGGVAGGVLGSAFGPAGTAIGAGIGSQLGGAAADGIQGLF